jgi:hypothetical protein
MCVDLASPQKPVLSPAIATQPAITGADVLETGSASVIRATRVSHVWSVRTAARRLAARLNATGSTAAPMEGAGAMAMASVYATPTLEARRALRVQKACLDSSAGTSVAMLSRAVGTAIVASQENVSAPRATRARLATSVLWIPAPTPASLNQSALGTRAAARTGGAMEKEAAQSASVALSAPTAPLVCIPSMEVSTTEGSVRTMEALRNGSQWMVLFSVAPHLAPIGKDLA